MPRGECTVTLEDVAYQLGLPFKNMMTEGIGRPRWDWFQEMFGEFPNEPADADACTVTFSWLRSRFGVLPRHLSNEMVLRHVDTARVRSACLAVQESVPSSQQECCPGGKAFESATELDFLAVYPPSPLRFRLHRVAIGLQVVQVSPQIRREGAPTAVSQEAAQFDALKRVRLSPVSDVGGRGGAQFMHFAGGSQGPLVLDRPTNILWDHRVQPGRLGGPTVWRGAKSSSLGPEHRVLAFEGRTWE
ncbi:hypothetical protein PIB30_016499 [Stylosanthes scabra]|uniref:Uncharacterized protein n=1 Tax=Stylosanthes scabra TaxID=79078 RepID=A0ABU6Z6W5_9FABA|nr:hypothetical protein [Stylosanthes scabra]